ncbi:COX15/CtaA family protein [Terriglobus saanensis]|uniref:Cytochrome oxidase assembly n=1 Tax=Terriglobus saanensis (strain ATCC BAA-1853 / DSM 23119 / SP1PR4) TaxID=401053 RepID=E8V009_TERSS|nr:COX15/CtaA family protein [Terriglobus saanensis]ADV82164.1 cytochrome oxidase assembly [Terriglobus saanensis SP1PR4]
MPTMQLRTAKRGTYLARFAWGVLGWNVLVASWGAIVRSTGSGAGCGNHWPLCNGDVIPVSPNIHTMIEFAHRMMTGVAAFAMVALVVLVLRNLPKPHPARKAVVFAAILLVVEAILGALLVKLGYVTGNRSVARVVFLGVHFANTFLLLASLTLAAWLVSGNPAPRLRAMHWLTLASTLVVGVSGSLAALGDTLFPATSLRAAFAQDFAADAPMLLRLRSVHPLSVLVATAALIWLTTKARELSSPRVKKLIGATLALLAFQIFLGIADLALLAPWWMQVLHLLGADLYWSSLLMLVFDASTSREVSAA